MHVDVPFDNVLSQPVKTLLEYVHVPTRDGAGSSFLLQEISTSTSKETKIMIFFMRNIYQ